MEPTTPRGRPALERFSRQAVAAEEVWGLEGPDGFAVCEANGVEGAPVLLFWAEAKDARAALPVFGAGYELAWISLFDLLFRWLPEMAEDGVLAGPDWTPDLNGPEIAPLSLLHELQRAMPQEMVNAYELRLEEEMSFED